MINRNFNELKRFYITNNDQKVHGLKQVHPSVPENIR